MKITKIAFIAYGVSDIPKARKFYEGFLGLTPGTEFPPKDDSMYVEYDIAGETFAIGCSPQWPPSETGASAALEVDNLEEWIEVAKKQNIAISSGPHDFPGCKMIVLLDPDRNKVTLHQKK